MKNKRFFLLIPALLPLAFKARYLQYAWQSSPLDELDWIFPVAALILAAIKIRTLRKWTSEPDLKGLIPAAAALCIYGFFIIKPIATFQIAAGIFFFFSALWILGGVQLFTGCLPLFALCLLACPSTTYWSEFYLRLLLKSDLIDGFVFKLCLGTVFAVFFLTVRKPLKLKTAAYLSGLALLAGLLLLQANRPLYGASLEPDLTRLKIGDYIAVPTEPTNLEVRFFRGSRLSKIGYYDDYNRSIHLLSVTVTGDAHKLHPTELCLKSKRIDIRGLREKKVTVRDGKNLALQELVSIRPGNRKFLIYTWYNSPDFSTGNFITFRKNWQRTDRWQSFQLLTEITDSREAAEKRLNSFLKKLFAGD